MSDTSDAASSSAANQPVERASPAPLPAHITSVQPGGGVCYSIELAWGRWRRAYLKRFRAGYLQRMAALRRGDAAGAPHEILDPRDLKYCRNLCTAHWAPEDDPFRWRENIPLARWGLAESQIMGWPLLAATLALALSPWKLAAVVPAVVLGWLLYFFRDPERRVPSEPGQLVSPADGTVAEITRLPHHDELGGPAVRIGIFLSIFNVHINRSPLEARVIELRYHPGKFLNALKPESALENENMWIAREEEAAPHRRMIVRQIAGAIARRIVCALRPGDLLARGEKFGMIKLGSRTELILPDEPGLEIPITLGQKLAAGVTVVARYGDAPFQPRSRRDLAPRENSYDGP